jgi:hypothetical protein
MTRFTVLMYEDDENTVLSDDTLFCGTTGDSDPYDFCAYQLEMLSVEDTNE